MFEAYLILALLTLQAFDFITTYLCLTRGKGHEANPVMASIFAKMGVLPGLVIVKGALIALLYLYGSTLPALALYALAAGYGLVIINNLRVLKS